MTGRSLMLEKAAPPVYWLLLVGALWLLIRGHNAPGGGFIAGLVAVAATALMAIVFDAAQASRRLPLPAIQLAATGVALALLSGLPAVLLGKPLLTHLWWTLDLGVTAVKLSTVLVFDLGVFCAVWGAFVFYLLALLEAGEAS